MNTIKVSNSLDPDQARHFVRPDLGSNCFQRLSAGATLDKELTLSPTGVRNFVDLLLKSQLQNVWTLSKLLPIE